MNEKKVDVLAVMDSACAILSAANTRVAESELRLARASVAELIEAHKASVDEIGRLRDAMFSVYAIAANGGDTVPAIELMRDEMDKPWSVDRSRAALVRIGSAS